MNTQYIGMVANTYTPQVEGQLMRDLIAATTQLRPGEELVLCSPFPEAERIAAGLGVRWTSSMPLAKVCLSYRTEDTWPEVPETTETEVQRDLYVRSKGSQLRTGERPAYYLPPQGRYSPDTIGLKRPAPNGYAPVSPWISVLLGG